MALFTSPDKQAGERNEPLNENVTIKTECLRAEMFTSRCSLRQHDTSRHARQTYAYPAASRRSIRLQHTASHLQHFACAARQAAVGAAAAQREKRQARPASMSSNSHGFRICGGTRNILPLPEADSQMTHARTTLHRTQKSQEVGRRQERQGRRLGGIPCKEAHAARGPSRTFSVLPGERLFVGSCEEAARRAFFSRCL